MSREVITEYEAHGPRPSNITVTITTDERGRMTIEVIDLPEHQVPTLLNQATQVIKRMRGALRRADL